MVPATVWWLIWKEWNIQVFNKTAELSFQVYRREKEKVVSWTVHRMGPSSVGRVALLQGWAIVIGVR